MKNFLLFLIGLVIGIYSGLAMTECEILLEHQFAIEAGVAEYVIDSKTGKTSFVYKKNESLIFQLQPIPSQSENRWNSAKRVNLE